MGQRHHHRPERKEDSSDDAVSDRTDSPPPSESDGGYSSDSGSSDKEELISKKKRKKKHHHFVGGGSHAHAHSHGEMNLGAVLVVAVVVVLCIGAYWVYSKNGGFFGSLFPSSSSSGGSSASSSGSTSTSGGSGGGGAGSGSSNPPTGTSAGGGAASSTGSKTGSESSGSSSSGGSSATSSGTAPASTGGSSSGGGGGGKVVSFFENWKGVDPATLDFSGLYAAFWFTAVPDASGSVDLHESTTGQAKTFAEAATKAGTKPMLTVGGWSGSAPFTKLVASDDSRSKFVDTMVKLMEDNSFEGLDIDWEYPGKAGASEDFDVKNDLNNLLLLLQGIREKIGSDKLLSMDTSSGVYNAEDGNPSKDMTEFGKVLDFITIMTYDATTYSSKTTGPNFAFSSKCAPSTGTYEIPTTVQAWIDAKFPAEKISVGLAAYGYAWEVDDFKDGGGVDGASSSIYQTSSKNMDEKDGSVPYEKIVSDYLDKMDYTFDDCTSTPFLYSKDTKLFIAYDDEKSFAAKGGIAKEKSLFGCSVYAGLTQDSDGKLTKAAIDAC